MGLHRIAIGAVLLGLASACTGVNPVYLDPTPAVIEVNNPAQMGMNANVSTTSTMLVPMRPETTDEATARAALATKLGLTTDQIAQIRRDDVDIEIEWTVKNLDAKDGTAEILVVGANEFFRYNPMAFVIDPKKDQTPPPLLGNIPIVVPASGEASGVFREDEVAEAAQDLDAITRAGIRPEMALLTTWPTGDVTGGAMGAELATIPSAAIPALIELDVSFTGDTHMVLEYVVRVRDRTNRLLPTVSDPAMLVPAAARGNYVPPPPPAMM